MRRYFIRAATAFALCCFGTRHPVDSAHCVTCCPFYPQVIGDIQKMLKKKKVKSPKVEQVEKLLEVKAA